MKLALLFLTRRGVVHDRTWRVFLDDPHLTWRLHVADDSPQPEFWEDGRITTVPTAWGHISLVHAMLALLRAAYEDPAVSHFAFVSESCLPIMNRCDVLAVLEADHRSRFVRRHHDPMSRDGLMQRVRHATLPREHLRVHSQWVVLNRDAAGLVLQEDLTDRFSGVFAADEHYIGSVLAYRGLPESCIASINPTFVSWTDGKPEILDDQWETRKTEAVSTGAFFARKFTDKFDPQRL